MWQIISRNRRKSIFLLVLMALVLLLLGFLIGIAASEDPAEGAVYGILLALFAWFSMGMVTFLFGDKMILSMTHAREITHEANPQLFNIVEEMKIAANLHAMPRIFIVFDRAPNAFAVGRRPEKSAVVVTSGLLSCLDRDELQGVIAHEISHIMNRDTMLMTFAYVLVGSICLLSEAFVKGLVRSSGSSESRESRNSSKNDGAAKLVLLAIALLFAIISPIIAQLLYLAISRKREYLADACAVRLTRYPEGLASALEKISSSYYQLDAASRLTAPMFIINPFLNSERKLSDLSSTHPPTSERINILRAMAIGVNFKEYAKAYSEISGKASRFIPRSMKSDESNLRIRTTGDDGGTAAAGRFEAGKSRDMLRKLNNYFFVTCECGLKLKVPPDYVEDLVSCPKCGKLIAVYSEITVKEKTPLIWKVVKAAVILALLGGGVYYAYIYETTDSSDTAESYTISVESNGEDYSQEDIENIFERMFPDSYKPDSIAQRIPGDESAQTGEGEERSREAAPAGDAGMTNGEDVSIEGISFNVTQVEISRENPDSSSKGGYELVKVSMEGIADSEGSVNEFSLLDFKLQYREGRSKAPSSSSFSISSSSGGNSQSQSKIRGRMLFQIPEGNNDLSLIIIGSSGEEAKIKLDSGGNSSR